MISWGWIDVARLNGECVCVYLILSVSRSDPLGFIGRLKLHSNRIYDLPGLGHLSFLKELDLSSNRVYRIHGLDGLHSLEATRGMPLCFHTTTPA